MAKHRGPTDLLSELALTERVREVISNRWAENLKAAARQLEVDYSLVLRVVRDGQPPPSRLLLQLVRHGDANAAWLLSGVAVPEDGPALAVPLVDRLPPGALTESLPPRWVATVPAHPEVARPTVYAYRVPRGDAVVRAKDWKVQAGDVLYIETGPADRYGVGRTEPRRLVVWRWLGGPNGSLPVTALGDVRTTDGGCVARVFGRKSETYPYDPATATGPESTAYPPAPGPGDTLGPQHLAGVNVALTRIDLGFLDQLGRL